MKIKKLSKGILIVLLGPDGSGKTTVINEIVGPLAEKFVGRNIRIIHHRPAWLPRISELLGKKCSTTPDDIDFTPHKAAPSGFIGSLLRLIYYTVDYTIGYFIKIYFKLRKGEIIIFDRYYYDFIVDPKRSRINLPEPVIYFFLKIVPAPDYIFFLDNLPDIIFSRKQELSLEEIKRQLYKYRQLSLLLKNYTIIPPGEGINEILKRILSIINPHPD